MIDIIEFQKCFAVYNPRSLKTVCSKETAKTIASWAGANGDCSIKILEQMIRGSTFALLEAGASEKLVALVALALWSVAEDDERTLLVELYVSNQFSLEYQKELAQLLVEVVSRQFKSLCSVIIFSSRGEAV